MWAHFTTFLWIIFSCGWALYTQCEEKRCQHRRKRASWCEWSLNERKSQYRIKLEVPMCLLELWAAKVAFSLSIHWLVLFHILAPPDPSLCRRLARHTRRLWPMILWDGHDILASGRPRLLPLSSPVFTWLSPVLTLLNWNHALKGSSQIVEGSAVL